MMIMRKKIFKRKKIKKDQFIGVVYWDKSFALKWLENFKKETDGSEIQMIMKNGVQLFRVHLRNGTRIISVDYKNLKEFTRYCHLFDRIALDPHIIELLDKKMVKVLVALLLKY